MSVVMREGMDRPSWFQDIHLLQTSPLKELLLFFLRTEGSLRAATTVSQRLPVGRASRPSAIPVFRPYNSTS